MCICVSFFVLTLMFSNLKYLWTMPWLCMNSRALAMPLAHRITLLATPGIVDRYIVLILEDASHEVFLAEFHHESYSQLIFFSNLCSTIELNVEWMIQLPKKKWDSWITFNLVSLKQYHSLFHQLIVVTLWFHYVVIFLHFVFIVSILLSKIVNYQKTWSP